MVEEKDSVIRNYYIDRSELDITDKAAGFNFLESNEIDIIVNYGPYLNVNKVEDDRENADLINYIGARNLV